MKHRWKTTFQFPEGTSVMCENCNLDAWRLPGGSLVLPCIHPRRKPPKCDAYQFDPSIIDWSQQKR